MLNVTEEQKAQYNANSIHKQLIVKLQGYSDPLASSQIMSESMELKEMLLDGKNVEFVGCNSSEFTIKIRGDILSTPKNKKITVSIKTDDTDPIPLFNGYIYSAKKDGSSGVRTIKAYDILYQKGQIDVAEFYKSLPFPITIGKFREYLFNFIGLEVVSGTVLPNDNLVIERQYEPQTLKCLSVLKAICQINGCFGIINRDEKFEFRFLQKDSDKYDNYFNFWKKFSQEEFYVKPFDTVVIRDSEKDAGTVVSESMSYKKNKYIIQANMFTYKLKDADRKTVAQNILNTISGISFAPIESDNNGLPFLEVGDSIMYPFGNPRGNMKYRVLNREMKGVQALRDNYRADGDEEASEYITDLQTQIDTIKQSGGGAPDDVYTKEETEQLIDEKISTETFRVVSVPSLPADRENGTLYLIQTDITVL